MMSTISHFSTFPTSFAIKPKVYFLTHQYLIINNSQSLHALSVSVRTVLWIYFPSDETVVLHVSIQTYYISEDLCNIGWP